MVPWPGNLIFKLLFNLFLLLHIIISRDSSQKNIIKRQSLKASK